MQLEIAHIDGWYDPGHSNSFYTVGYKDQKKKLEKWSKAIFLSQQ